MKQRLQSDHRMKRQHLEQSDCAQSKHDEQYHNFHHHELIAKQ
jgi:hypothetical protein